MIDMPVHAGKLNPVMLVCHFLLFFVLMFRAKGLGQPGRFSDVWDDVLVNVVLVVGRCHLPYRWLGMVFKPEDGLLPHCMLASLGEIDLSGFLLGQFQLFFALLLRFG